LIGFLSQLCIAYFFGTGSDRDGFFAAIIVPTYLVTIFVGSIGVVFLSTYIDVSTKSTAEAQTFLNVLVSYSFLFLSVLAVLGAIFSRQIISFTASGFSDQQIDTAALMLRILMPTLIFQVLINIFSSVFQARHQFVLPGVASLVTPTLTLVSVVLFREILGINSLAWGNLVGVIISSVLLFASLYKTDSINFCLRRNSNLEKLAITALPLFMGGIIYRFSGIWERSLASGLSIGSISFLGYANQLLVVFATITTGGIATIFFPMLSRAWSSGDKELLESYFQRAVILLVYITFPIAFIYCFLRIDFVGLLFERGAFNHQSTVAVSNVLALMMVAFICQSLGSIIVRAFYFMEKTVTVSIIGVVEIGVYIITSLLLVNEYSYKALAIALSISTLANVFISSLIVNKKINFLNWQLFINFIKILLCCILSLWIVSLLDRSYYKGLIRVILSGSIFFLIYFILTCIFNVKESLTLKLRIVQFIKKKFNGKY